MNNHKLAGRAAGKTDAADGAAGGPRTMRFLVERMCPTLAGKPGYNPEALAEVAPCVVWVRVEPTVERCSCGGVTHRIDTGAPMSDKHGRVRRITSPPGSYPAVREHMGHLIE